MVSMARFVAVALLVSPSVGLTMQDRSSKHLGVLPQYKQDCWQKRGAALVQNVPGAGIDKFTAYETVLKDGFLEAQCVKDYMFSFGDKFGDNKHDYKLQDRSNVSIVHYSAHVAKEDRKAMTPTVCFEFCRTVPNMGFFGITNGRHCYCTPYYKPMESSSANCDATCEGDATLMCGGKDKSTVFGMHMCANTAQDLTDAVGKAGLVATEMKAEIKIVEGLSTDMQASAAGLQASFGQVGDSASSNLFQSAKAFAGELEHAAEDATKIATKLEKLKADSKTVVKFTDPKDVSKAEDIVADIEKTLVAGEAAVKNLGELEGQASAASVAGADKQYYPVMYFVDKEQDKMPATCGGDAVGKPIVGEDMTSCATACDKHTTDCVGFSHYDGPKGKLCFLFKKFTSAFYYTGCGAAPKAAFLQTAAAPFTVSCMAKFSEFDGTTLKPDASGKCKQCFKTVTKADRCFK